MKKLKKILSLFLICVVTIMSLPFVSLAASVGEQLTSPEDGWQRFDNINEKIVYTGNWLSKDLESFYNGEITYTTDNSASISFEFYGTQLRILGNVRNAYRVSDAKINIDGKTYSFTQIDPNSTLDLGTDQVICYEITDLSAGNHVVSISSTQAASNRHLTFDAIDIDNNGYLLPYNPEEPEEPTNSLKVVAEVGETIQLSVNDTLSNNTKMTWTSSDSAIASVDSQGVVTGVAPGNAVITVENADGTYKETINILVIDSEPELAVDLNVGDTRRLTVDDLTDTVNATWTSNDETIATVDNKGKVTAVSPGTTFITVTDDQGNEIGKLYIRVRN